MDNVREKIFLCALVVRPKQPDFTTELMILGFGSCPKDEKPVELQAR